MTPRSGCYIALEGAEGCGKSTHAARLGAAIGALVTREHGGTRIGTLIRAILADPANTDLTDRAEALLVAADRAQHLETVVVPTLAAGRHVVSDRSVYSSLAYQGYGRGLPLGTVRAVNEWAIGGRWPDLVILLTISDEQTAARLRRRELDRFERADGAFFARVDAGFGELAAADPDRWVIVEASGPREQTAASIRDAVRERLGI